MKSPGLGAWLAIAFGAIYFIVPLIATFEFSLRKRRGEWHPPLARGPADRGPADRCYHRQLI